MFGVTFRQSLRPRFSVRFVFGVVVIAALGAMCFRQSQLINSQQQEISELNAELASIQARHATSVLESLGAELLDGVVILDSSQWRGTDHDLAFLRGLANLASVKC